MAAQLPHSPPQAGVEHRLPAARCPAYRRTRAKVTLHRRSTMAMIPALAGDVDAGSAASRADLRGIVDGAVAHLVEPLHPSFAISPPTDRPTNTRSRTSGTSSSRSGVVPPPAHADRGQSAAHRPCHTGIADSRSPLGISTISPVRSRRSVPRELREHHRHPLSDRRPHASGHAARPEISGISISTPRYGRPTCFRSTVCAGVERVQMSSSTSCILSPKAP